MAVMAFVSQLVISQVVLKPNQSYHYYPGLTLTDTLKASAAGSWEYAVNSNKDEAMYLSTSLKLNRSVTTTYPKCTVKVQGKVFDTDTYADITSMSVTVPASGKGLSSDTTITLSQKSTAQFYKYFRILLSGTSVSGNPEMNIGWVKWKFWTP